jgi:hypothetical protein
MVISNMVYRLVNYGVLATCIALPAWAQESTPPPDPPASQANELPDPDKDPQGKQAETYQKDSDVQSRTESDKSRLRERTRSVDEKAGLGVNVTNTPSRGLRVERVFPGSPAAEAGLRRGDQIIQVDNQPIRTFRNLLTAIRSKEPGDRIQLTIIRNGAERVLNVILESVEEALINRPDRFDDYQDIGPPSVDHDQLAQLLRGLEEDIDVLTREVRALKQMLSSDPDAALDHRPDSARNTSEIEPKTDR